MASFKFLIGRFDCGQFLAHPLNLNGKSYARVVKAMDTDVNPYCDLDLEGGWNPSILLLSSP